MAGAAATLALLVAAIAAAPIFVDTHRVKLAVERQISEVAGGEVTYESLKVRLFPQPHAEVHNATVRIPGAVDGRIGRLEIRIALLPLLAGNVRPVAVNVKQPVLEVRIQPGGGGGDPLAAYREALGPVVDALVRQAQGMSLGITDGKLDVVYAGQRVLSLSGLAADAEVAADAITVSASAGADLWQTAKAGLTITPGSLAATGKVQVGGLRLAELLQAAGLQGEVRVLPAAVDATLAAETDGRESVRASVTMAAPALTVVRGARTLELGAIRAAVDARRDGGALAVSLTQLQVGDHVPAATGTLRARPDGSGLSVELQVPALDLARLRAAALALAGDLDAVKTATTFVTAGAAQNLKASAAGSDFGSLATLGSVRADAQIAAAALAFPDLGISIASGSGNLVLADGTLRGSALAGTIGASTFKDGTLALELAPAVALRELDAAVDADLAEVLAIARPVLGRKEPAALADVESLRGRAAGTVAYEAHPRHPRVTVDLAQVRASGRYRGVPMPIEVTRGAVRYADDRVVLRGVAGSLGRSSIRDGALELALGAEPVVRAASADATILVDEFYPWLASFEGLRRPASGIPSATGTVAVRLLRLSGPLNTPADLEYEVLTRPQQVRLAGPALPAPVTLASGALHFTPRSVALDRVDVAMLDARIVATGTIEDYASAEPRLDLALADGNVGGQALEWAHKRWQLPGRAMPRPPVTLTSGRVQRAGGSAAPLNAQGALGLAAGVRAEFDLATEAGHLDLRRLVVKDPDTDTVLSLKWAASTAEVAFNGTFDNRTLGRVFAELPSRQGALRGNFRATIDLAEPRRSTAEGSLEGERIDILQRWDIPVAIERVRIDVAGDVVQIREGAFAVAGERLEVTGAITSQPKTFGVDLRATADAIDAERVLRAFPRGEAKPPGRWNLPVDGRVAVDAKSIAYGAHTFRPVSGVVTLAPERIVADVTEARLCGIALPLNAVMVPGNVSVTGRVEARAVPLVGTAECLTGEEVALTGALDVEATLSASAPPAELARAVRGAFRLTARNGRILKALGIARILALEAVSSALRASPGELMARGLDYSEILIAGTLDAGRAQVTTGTINAAALAIAMTGEVDFPAEQLEMHGIVAPFGRIQSVVQYVPIVGQVLGTHTIGIPVTVRGDLRDPTVVPLGPAAIGQSLVNLLGTVVKTPVDLLDPFLGRLQRPPE